MSDTGDGTATGDYDNETAGLEEKLLEGKRVSAEIETSDDTDMSDEVRDAWETDGGRYGGRESDQSGE
ncbi:MAG: hypothetical protein ACO27U_09305 [Ilumatobacteraceae bacterium]|jgi:hypothetical protein